MQTERLIKTLAMDRQPAALAGGYALAIYVAAGWAISVVFFWAILGPRPDIANAAATFRFDIKIVEALLLGATAAALCVKLARPAAATKVATLALLAAPALLAGTVAAELLFVPAAQWPERLVGSNARICLTAIPLLSLAPLAGALIALREGAPLRPGLTGAAAGLLAGGFAAALYAIHCTDDSPLFVATWYPIAIGMVTLVGAASGRYLLRW